ncbi:MAG TPA: PEGA domain-containing protein, partial [Kofleriaceae bacterium]|nr:PEGA domain-containing protein [Kofleriaceae bacterium]
HTESGQIKGKLGYMSPEAVTGRAFLPVSDVFSAGVVAHELLTAHPLFSAKTDYETLIRIHEAEIQPPSRRNPGVPAALDEVVLAALSRDPERRLQTAGEFRAALEYVAEQAGVRFSARDVTEWRAKIATTEDPWGSRTSLPNVSSSVVSRAFPYSESRNSLSGPHQRPFAPEPSSGRPRSHSQLIARPGRTTGQFAEMPPAEDKSVADMTWGSDQQVPMQERSDQSMAPPAPVPPVSAPPPPPMMMPPIGASIQARRNSGARLALIVLFAIAAGLAVYQFLLRPKKPVATPAVQLASLKFIVQPADAIVEIGGKEAGRTSPFESQFEPGVLSVSVHRQGYKPWTTEVTLREGDKQTVRVALEVGMAHLNVTSDPPGLVAQLDGKPLDEVTPLEIQTTAGHHQLTVTSAVGLTWSQDFTAEIDRKYTFHAPLAGTKHATSPALGTAGATHPAPTASSTSAPTSATHAPPDRDRSKRSGTGTSSRTAAKDQPAEVETRGPDPEPEHVTRAEPPPPPAPKIIDAGVLPVTPPEPPKPTTIAPLSNKAIPVVAPGALTKLLGEIPTIKAEGVADNYADVKGKLCIDDHGKVTSASIKTIPEIAEELHRALLSWRYKPYLNSAGQASPVCIALSFRVVFKHSN